jgi:hypothetical protein
MDLGQTLQWNGSTRIIVIEHQQFLWSGALVEDTWTSKWNDPIWDYKE